ncbi:hypothetical protein [Phyllobacterium sp. K27]
MMTKPTHLVVVLAFNRTETGEFVPAFDPMQFECEERALRSARKLAEEHADVIAWSRPAQAEGWSDGPPTIIFQLTGRTGRSHAGSGRPQP